MKKPIVVATGVAVIVLIGMVTYAFLNQPKQTEMQDVSISDQKPVQENTTATTQGKSSPVSVSEGKYVAYSQTEFENTKGTRLLFFHAPWCPQCQKLDKSITAQPKIADNTTIYKVDYDSQNDLRVKYGVTLQTTIVKVDQNGNKIDSFVAYQNPSYESLATHFNL